MVEQILDCPCGGKAILSENIGPLSRAEWKDYYCSNRYITGCRLIKSGSSRDRSAALKKWNKAVKSYSDS